MASFTRRRFCALLPPALGLSRYSFGAAVGASAYEMVAATDRARILKLADRWVPEKPLTITALRSPRSPGKKNDYFSEADYFWPNPANPNGPYKEIDGKSNPDNFLEHRKALIRMSQAVPALAAGYLLTKKKAYARAASAHVLAWFVDPRTMMNPNLEFAQGVRNGGPTGRSYGVIDTLHLAEVARAIPFITAVMNVYQFESVQRWFKDYLQWMRSSDKGAKERDATNNHSLAWGLQAAEFARLVNDEADRDKVRERFHNVQLPEQMAADGSFSRELARTKPYGYSIFAFDVAAALAWSLSETGTTGEQVRYARPDGRGMCKAAEFLYPFLEDKGRWTGRHDVEHWESWPVRSPGLLFCGAACDKPEYLQLWRKLDPDPTDPEVIRNFPVRQPLLWVAPKREPVFLPPEADI